jgi:hypothetical protein
MSVFAGPRFAIDLQNQRRRQERQASRDQVHPSGLDPDRCEHEADEREDVQDVSHS